MELLIVYFGNVSLVVLVFLKLRNFPNIILYMIVIEEYSIDTLKL